MNGDIVEISGDYAIVEYNECKFVYRDDNVIIDQLEDIADICEVFGNIYENKELLVGE